MYTIRSTSYQVPNDARGQSLSFPHLSYEVFESVEHLEFITFRPMFPLGILVNNAIIDGPQYTHLPYQVQLKKLFLEMIEF